MTRLKLKKFFDADWLRALDAKTDGFVDEYLECWSPIRDRLDTHLVDATGNFLTASDYGNRLKKKQRHAFKDTFKYFTAHLKDMAAQQATWIVPKIELRDTIHEAVEGIVVERYDTFCRLALSLIFSKNPDRHQIFTVVKVRDLILSTLTGRV